MKHLLTEWQEVEPLLRDRNVMLFLDYDGTLTPIVKHPKLARLAPDQRKILKNLAQTSGIQMAIVSGRGLGELKELVGIEGLIYVGNHGLELEAPKLRFIHPGAREAQQLLQKVAGRLEKALEAIPGILVENKVLTLSVHYRQVSPENLKRSQEIFSKIIHPYTRTSQLFFREGKKVWEIRPAVRWDKGTMVLWLFGRLLARSGKKILPIYVGDDQTDEDAFKALKKNGLTIKVTEETKQLTQARYFVRSPKEVFIFLERLKALQGKKEGRSL